MEDLHSIVALLIMAPCLLYIIVILSCCILEKTEQVRQQQLAEMPRRLWRRVARRRSVRRENTIDFVGDIDFWSSSIDLHGSGRSLTPPPLYDSCLPPSYEHAVGMNQTNIGHTTNNAANQTLLVVNETEGSPQQGNTEKVTRPEPAT